MTAAALPHPHASSATAPTPTPRVQATGQAWGEREWTRLRWGVRSALVLGVAASMVANILHAQPNPISQAIAAWPPLALLFTVELIARVPVHRRALATGRLLAATTIAGIAAYVSYWHMVGVAARYGETGAAPYLLPLSVDGLIIVASICLVEISGRLQQNVAAPTSTPIVTLPRVAPPPCLEHASRPSAAHDTACAAPPHTPPTPSQNQASPHTRPTPQRSQAAPSSSLPPPSQSQAPPSGPATTTQPPAREPAPGTPSPATADAGRHEESRTHEFGLPPTRKARPSQNKGADDNSIPTDPREAIQYWLHRDPNMDVDTLAGHLGKSVRQVRRYLASPATGTRTVNGNRPDRPTGTAAARR